MTRARDPLDLDGDRAVTALLGPTNTGKTHRALERMLVHGTGVIGLPLRLLAREVYDRLVAIKGTDAIALVTGEEKRIPPRARWFVCTVEAMPLDRAFGFVAVDEIQLAADPGRGHVFTDRILRARGVHETLLLGSDTFAPMLERLVPGVRIELLPRLSSLRGTPPRKLIALPKRSAVVAFSAREVYALAERLRGQWGGTAVVLGALSPRARNAQIAMYQAGEVHHVVATDAIGMGLNLDIDHVAFAATRKFDGERVRDLRPAEIGQIAGRAGRGRRDGTFGATADHGPLDPDLVTAVEAQRFDPVAAVFWRNPDLDLSSIGDLQESLTVGPVVPELLRKRDADDHRALDRLALAPEVVRRARTRGGVALLWDVCSVPDFAKSPGHHTALLERLFVLLHDYGRIPAAFVDRRVDELDRTAGDIDVLVDRIAGIRTFAFLAHRAAWVEDPDGLRQRARDVEDRLSDALHDQLTRRFVDPKARIAVSPERFAGDAGIGDDGQIRVGEYDLGRIVGFTLRPSPSGSRLAGRALGRALDTLLGHEIDHRVDRCVDAPDEDFEVRPDGLVAWGGGPVAELVAGPDALSPRLRPARLDLLGLGGRERIRRRLLAWLSGHVARVEDALRAPDGLGPAGRGFLWQLQQALGMVSVDPDLPGADRRALAEAGVRFGRRWAWIPAATTPAAIASRALLWAIHVGHRPLPHAPVGVFAAADTRPVAQWAACGFVVLGARAIRVDVAEAVAARLDDTCRVGLLDPPVALAGWIGAQPHELPAVLAALGWRRRADGRWEAPRRASA